MLPEIFRRRAYHASNVADADRSRGRIRQLADAHADVQSLLEQVDDAVEQHGRNGHFRKAAEVLDDARRHVHAAEEHRRGDRKLPARPGVSQGTALYYLGVALEKLNYKSQAMEAYREAAGHKDATLINNDGPAVAPLAARRGGQ